MTWRAYDLRGFVELGYGPEQEGRELCHSTAVELSERFFGDPEIEIEKIDWATIHRAQDLFSEKDFLSFTDATTAIVMDARGVEKIFTFDSDFERLGFETIGT